MSTESSLSTAQSPAFSELTEGSSLPTVSEDDAEFYSYNLSFFQHHFELLSAWEFPPFTMLTKDNFLSDLRTGRSRYCSPALLAAMVSLSSRLHIDEGAETCACRGRFARDAEVFTEEKSSYWHLPNIQALGLMSLRQIQIGEELEAKKLILRCLGHIKKSFHEKVDDNSGIARDEQYCAAVAVTFQSAMALARMIQFVATEPSVSMRYWLPHSQFGSADLLYYAISGHDIALTNLLIQLAPKQLPTPSVPVQLVGLVDTVHSALRSHHDPNSEGLIRPLESYQKCLDWYRHFMVDLRRRKADLCSPSVLFVHILYHFCLLTLFRPLLALDPAVTNISPRTICDEASGTVLMLARAFSNLFTLRRTPTLMPYFVYIAGVMQLELASYHRVTSLPTTRSTQLALPETGKDLSASSYHAALTVEALSQLTQMAPTHPAAAEGQMALYTSYAALQA